LDLGFSPDSPTAHEEQEGTAQQITNVAIAIFLGIIINAKPSESTMTSSYQSPVDRLLACGNCIEMRKERPIDYPSMFGLTAEHIPALIEMVADEALHWADPDSLEVWGPVHAWRALGQLRAEEAIAPLLDLFYRIAEEEDDWLMDEMPDVFGKIGPAAIAPLNAYLMKKSHKLSPRVTAVECLTQIAERHPETRSECIAIFLKQLDPHSGNDPEFKSWLVNALVGLKAVEAAPAIQQATEDNRLDRFIAGDWDSIQEELGLKTHMDLLRERATQPDFSHSFKPKQPVQNLKGTGGFGASESPGKSHSQKKKKKR
jgi:hypothetical protein